MKTKERNIHELLVVMRDNLIIATARLGLCILITDLYMDGLYTYDEADLVQKYINGNRPNLGKAWGWPIGDIESRKNWLDEHIELTHLKKIQLICIIQLFYLPLVKIKQKDMTNKEELSKALLDFKAKYPSITSADLQTFVLGWEAASMHRLENKTMDEFIVIAWPEVQNYFELEGFAENSLLICDGSLYEEYGDSAYMVRKSWIEEFGN